MATSIIVNPASPIVGYKIDIDDTQPLFCTFEATETIGDHNEYIIRVQRGFDLKNSWTIRKRYREFDELYVHLKAYNLVDLKLPPKKMFGNLNKEFISDRQAGLQEFLSKLLSNHLLANTLYVKKFLNELNYAGNFRESSLEHVSMFFRSEAKWKIVEPLNDIGWRFRKQYLLIDNSDGNTSKNKKYILSWCDYGPDKALKDVDLSSLFTQLAQIQHDHIQPIIRIYNTEFGALCIQEYNESGSLRDFIYSAKKPCKNFMKKYSLSDKTDQSHYDIEKIKCYSKQVLEALNFLYSKGLFYGHLHSGNVMIVSPNKIQLTDLSNPFLGLPYYYRQYVIEQRRIQTMENVDVYGFGHMLYELAYMKPLNSSFKDNFDDCPYSELKPVLEMILTSNALRNGLPTLSLLLQTPLFAEQSSTITSTKFSTTTKFKELVLKSRENIEKRISEDQKIFAKSKQKEKVESKIFSDTEIRKRRKEQKKGESKQSDSATPPISSKTSNDRMSQATIYTPVNTTPNGSPSAALLATQTLSHSPPPVAPPPAPPPPVAPLVPQLKTNSSETLPERSQLLSSISSFTKTALKKTITVDKSKPRI